MITEEIRSIGRVITPEEPGYDQAREVWSARFEARPSEIVYCQSAQDVANALRQALREKRPFRARCGGHCYEGYSTLDAGMVIDVTDLSTISVSQDRTTAVIGGGCRLKDVYAKLWQVGRTIPGGTCPSVGISGLAQGGGLGMLVRPKGLLIDSLLEVEIVDARGEILVANETSHPDLFWALRGGGGGNFGIVTALTFRLHPIDQVTLYTATWKWSELTTALDAWQRWAPRADERISSLFIPLAKSTGLVTSFGELVGTAEELRPLLEPLISAGSPTQISLQTLPYIDAVNTIANLEGDVSTSATSRVKGCTSYLARPLDAQGLATVEEWMAKAPAGAAPTFYALGGAISKVAPDATAFPYRREQVLISWQANWTDPDDDDANVAWVQGIRDAVQPHTTGGCYVNIPDRSLEKWAQAYYGDNLPRLVKVKRHYDPENVFRFPQSIPLELPV